jgi:hypothetical protein
LQAGTGSYEIGRTRVLQIFFFYSFVVLMDLV